MYAQSRFTAMLLFLGAASAFGQVGSKIWEFQYTGKYAVQTMCSPALATEGTIYFGTEVLPVGGTISIFDRPNGLLLALNPDGTLKWQFETPTGIITAPAVGSGGAIYFFTDYYIRNAKGFTKLYALNADGTKKWEFEAQYSVAGVPPVAGPPAIGSDGTIYAASTAEVFALRLDGSVKWRHAFLAHNNPVLSAFKPALALDSGDLTYIATSDGYFMALAPDGSSAWETPIGTDLRSPPAIGADGTIYVGGAGGRVTIGFGGKLYAFNSDGSLKWEFITDGRIDGSPVVAPDGTIYAGALDGKLYALRPDGTLRWTFASDGTITASPIIDSEGNIYFGSTSGAPSRVYAVSPSGEKLWDTEIRLSSSPVISSDGNLYVGSNNSIFYALRVGHPPATPGWPMLQQNQQRTSRAPITAPLAGELPKITTQAQSQSVSAGSDVSFVANASSPTPTKSQWRFNGANLPGATNSTLTLTNVSLLQAGRYALIVSNAVGSASSASVAMAVTLNLASQTLPIDLTGWNNDVVWENAQPSSAFGFFTFNILANLGERDGTSWVETGYQGRTDGLPSTRRITSLVNTNVIFQLQPYTSKNVLMLTSSETNHTGTLSLATPGRYTYLFVLAASGIAGGGMGQLVLNFTDGTASEPIPYLAEYWHERTSHRAIEGLIALQNYVGTKSFNPGNDGWGASLYQTDIDLTVLHLDKKPIQSITFSKPGSLGPPYSTGIFAVSGVPAARGGRVEPPKRTANGGMEIMIPASDQTAQAVEASQDLINWVPLANLIPEGASVRVIDAEAALHTYRFYRAIFRE